MAPNAPAPVESIDRALSVLAALAEAGPAGMALADLAAVVGANKSTVYRAAHTLRLRGFALQDPVTGAYALGPEAVRLGRLFLGADSLRDDVHPALTVLSRSAGELVHLGMLSGDTVIYVDKVEPDRAISVRSQVGRSARAHSTALGRAMLAARGLGREGVAAYVPEGEAYREALVEHLWAEIERARRLGWSREVQENEPDVACLGVPILHGGRAVAAVSVTAPASRMTEGRMSELGERILRDLPGYLPAGYAIARPGG